MKKVRSAALGTATQILTVPSDRHLDAARRASMFGSGDVHRASADRLATPGVGKTML